MTQLVKRKGKRTHGEDTLPLNAGVDAPPRIQHSATVRRRSRKAHLYSASRRTTSPDQESSRRALVQQKKIGKKSSTTSDPDPEAEAEGESPCSTCLCKSWFPPWHFIDYVVLNLRSRDATIRKANTAHAGHSPDTRRQRNP
jgi:hypothetical protein